MCPSTSAQRVETMGNGADVSLESDSAGAEGNVYATFPRRIPRANMRRARDAPGRQRKRKNAFPVEAWLSR